MSAPFACTKCEMKFKMENWLKHHLITRHNMSDIKIDPFACTKCDMTFKMENMLKQHLITKHRLDNLPFKCSLCGACFKDTETFSIHLANHSVEVMDEGSKQVITSAGLHAALVTQLFSSWKSGRILPCKINVLVCPCYLSHIRNVGWIWLVHDSLELFWGTNQIHPTLLMWHKYQARTNKNI